MNVGETFQCAMDIETSGFINQSVDIYMYGITILSKKCFEHLQLLEEIF